MRLGTLIHHAHGCNCVPRIFFLFLPRDLVMFFQSRKNVGKFISQFGKNEWDNIHKFEAKFSRSALPLSFCKNRFCLSQFVKKLSSMKRGAFF